MLEIGSEWCGQYPYFHCFRQPWQSTWLLCSIILSQVTCELLNKSLQQAVGHESTQLSWHQLKERHHWFHAELLVIAPPAYAHPFCEKQKMPILVLGFCWQGLMHLQHQHHSHLTWHGLCMGKSHPAKTATPYCNYQKYVMLLDTPRGQTGNTR